MDNHLPLNGIQTKIILAYQYWKVCLQALHIHYTRGLSCRTGICENLIATFPFLYKVQILTNACTAIAHQVKITLILFVRNALSCNDTWIAFYKPFQIVQL